MIGYAFTGSFCTVSHSLVQLRGLLSLGYDVLPIMSERVYSTDTRFGKAAELIELVEDITSHKIVHTVEGAEPLGAMTPLEYMIIAPCTGNTLAKLASGITDTSVTMAAKAHLRCDRPLLIALASNDSMSQNLGNIARLLTRKSVYFLPLSQDDPSGKPHSLVANFSLLQAAFAAMQDGKQLRPLFV
ncbi:MAG: dipicolinate synthase subunit B [Clostridia bacterium]|nr:dipicolinate synthase subunit B [Clostridia bacterium]